MSRLIFFSLLALSLITFAGGSPVAADPPKDAPKLTDGFAGRTKAGKAKLLKEFGGSPEGEEAVMLGLAWLTQAQKPEGHWTYDGTGNRSEFHPASTGMAVLAFLGAGQSHQIGRYKQTVQAGLDWLVKDVETAQGGTHGKFKSSENMYVQGIASLALLEAYGMSRDPKLKPAAQAVVNFIQDAQGPRGSWGYTARTDNDTSILGWQIQVLHAAMLCEDLKVDKKVIEKAIAFLDYVSPGQTKSAYGYSGPGDAAPATACTSIGLLCRYYIDGWRKDTPGFAEGSKGLLRLAPAGRDAGPLNNLYYYYYATQVVRFHGGEEWKTWNEGAADSTGKRSGGLPHWLLNHQDRTPTNRGSWAAESGWLGDTWGRLGSTCFCLLMLEVYYRYEPEEKKPPK
jgi:hypothetical protein